MVADRTNEMKILSKQNYIYIYLQFPIQLSLLLQYHNNLIEATKSYLSLTEAEKQKFSRKLEEYKDKKKARFCEQLKSAKPYLKVKKDR